MKTACMIVLISIVSCVCVSFCYPSKPLNERSTELAWEAWLLVDQSNRQGDLGVLRRRITPKSVFIAPTFSPDSLPACAEGYKSDPMGRCVKIIKINESVHFDFLLQKLNERFPDYEEEPEDASTHGPLQLNIPLEESDDEILIENETDVAIVVTPSHRNHDKSTSLKIDIKRNGGFDSIDSVATIIGVKPEDVTMTTLSDLTARTITTMKNEETTTLQTTTVDGGETTETTTPESSDTTTLLEGDALYFQRRIQGL